MSEQTGIRGTDPFKVEWSKVIAHAWKNEAFMEMFRKDPKQAIQSVQEELQLQYITNDDLEKNPVGFFPISEEPPENIKDLSESELQTYLEENTGIFGAMSFCCV